MRKQFIGAVFAVLAATGNLSAAVTDDIKSDSTKSAKWFSEQVSNVMAFNAVSTPLLPASVLEVLGVEFGVAGGLSVSKLDVPEFRGLAFSALDNANKTVINLPDRIPAPAAVAHLKVGLPKGFDLGLKYGAINFDVKESNAKFKFENKVMGVELRKRLLGGGGLTGAALPDVAVSVAYDRASGDITRTERYNAPLLGGAGSLSADTTWKTDWNTGGVSARAVISKKLLIITPFAGVGFTKYIGDAETTVTTLGTLTPGGSINETAKAQEKPKAGVLNAVGGAELHFMPFLSLNLSTLWSKDDQAYQAGLRFQFR